MTVSNQENKNIIVISLCSLKLERLGLYGNNSSVTPHIDHFFSSKSLIFNNSFNSQSWTSLSSVFRHQSSLQFLLGKKFHLGGDNNNNHFIRIPPRYTANKVSNFQGLNYNLKSHGLVKKDLPNNTNEKKTNIYHNYFINRLKEIHKGESSFFVIAHYKHLHFPYIDQVNENTFNTNALSQSSKELLLHYKKNYHSYPDKLAFFILLWNDPEMIKSHPRFLQFKKQNTEIHPSDLLGLISSQKEVQKWKNSTNYEKDQKLLEEVYDLSLNYLDKKLGELFQYLEDSKLLDNTIIALVGDHGEPWGEHSFLNHGNSIYDESMKIGLLMRFPEKTLTQHIDQQIYQASVAQWIQESFLKKNFSKKFALNKITSSPHNKTILMRSCNNDILGLRYNNQYKFISSGNQKFLYDLQSDPQELKNLSKEKEDLVLKLELLYHKKKKDFPIPHPNYCPPWTI